MAGNSSSKAKKPNQGGYARSDARAKRNAARHEKSLRIAAEYKQRVSPILFERAVQLGFVVTRTAGKYQRKPSIKQLRAFIKMMEK